MPPETRPATHEDLAEWCERRGGQLTSYPNEWKQADMVDNQHATRTICELGTAGEVRLDTGERNPHVKAVGQVRSLGETVAELAFNFYSEDPDDLRYDPNTDRLVLDGEVSL